jgi:predicted ATPase
MIRSVNIVNVQCLRQVDVTLRPLNVLVGDNDTGKSTFLRALATACQGQAPSPSIRNPSSASAVRVKLDGLNIEHGVSNGTTGLNHLPTNFRGVGVTLLPNEGVILEGLGFADGNGIPGLSARGDNVAGLLDYFFRHDGARFQSFKDAVRKHVPGVADVQIATPNASTRRVDLVIEGNKRIAADRASTGVRAMIYYLALAHHPTPPPLVLLEEPETGLHPKRLEDVMKLLRAISKGEHGQPAQVVLTTHSPYLLDCVDLSTDQVLVFRRNEDGSRTAEHADEARLKVFLDEFKLGEVWFNRGEDGLLKIN